MKLKPMATNTKQEVKQLYEQAFPKEERRPFWMLSRQCKKGVMEILTIEEEEENVGLIISSFYKQIVLVEYFAVMSNQRGNGIGGRALTLAKERYKGKTLILEIEQPDPNIHDMKMRRQEFYNRHGFLDAGVEIYFHGVPMKILSYDGKQISYEQYKNHYKKTAGTLLTWYIGIKSIPS